jgi:hypothetical protein
MHRLSLLTRPVVLVAFLFSGCATMGAIGSASSLVNMLTSQLGVTANQANGGVGSTLNYAENKLNSTDFNSLTKVIPGSDEFMQSAKDLGAVKGPITDKAGLEAAYSRLGMGSEMTSKFNKTLGDIVGKAGGDSVKNLFGSLFK